MPLRITESGKEAKMPEKRPRILFAEDDGEIRELYRNGVRPEFLKLPPDLQCKFEPVVKDRNQSNIFPFHASLHIPSHP